MLVLQTERQSMLGGSVSDTTERAAQQIATRLQTLSTERTLRELQTRQREQVLDDRLRTTAQQLRQAEEESALQARRVQLAQTTLTRNQQLAESGFVAEAQVQVRQEELIDAKARAQALERARLGLMQDQQTLRGERIALKAQLQSDTNQIDRNRASLDQEASENAARKTMVISAPYAGTVENPQQVEFSWPPTCSVRINRLTARWRGPVKIQRFQGHLPAWQSMRWPA